MVPSESQQIWVTIMQIMSSALTELKICEFKIKDMLQIYTHIHIYIVFKFIIHF